MSKKEEDKLTKPYIEDNPHKRLKLLSRAYESIQKFRKKYNARLIGQKNYKGLGATSWAELMDEYLGDVRPAEFKTWKDYFKEHGDYMKSVEGKIMDEMKKEVRKEPLWTGFLQDVKGVGPRITAGLLGEIGDFDRFHDEEEPGVDNLIAYAGLHVDPETGKAARRKKGKPAPWNQRLRQILYLTYTSILKTKHHPGRYYKLYKKRKKYERKKHPKKVDTGRKNKAGNPIYKYTDQHIEYRTKRYIQVKFLSDLYHVWLGDFDLQKSKEKEF